MTKNNTTKPEGFYNEFVNKVVYIDGDIYVIGDVKDNVIKALRLNDARCLSNKTDEGFEYRLVITSNTLCLINQWCEISIMDDQEAWAKAAEGAKVIGKRTSATGPIKWFVVKQKTTTIDIPDTELEAL